jgi:hypothetical protein
MAQVPVDVAEYAVDSTVLAQPDSTTEPINNASFIQVFL